ncbi:MULTISPECIES: putative phage abortive infection protein [Myroides]|uniref:Putative phage abortive infection protein n=1 Tax=Myroides indicus TaxID=1323422 RepID=A0A4V3E942_9FLAO|nr:MULTISPECIES: putative phage abortive infection protein [Myroides]APA93459.1 hypothetical protein BK054_14735 [Myroides sp. ZB35]MDM1035327.1 putative phage abortive infection protein [Myroides odoratimimus]MDM1462025.1 putative phage abortive infection protein [Myroides odoratimimus]TDS64394.1 putative phage abortive infection protein [Myroides indicus]
MRIRIILSYILTIIGCIIIVWFLIRGIYFEDFINSKYNLDLDSSAKSGDFIGGFVGAIFTIVGIVLLYETLSLQRQEFIESRNVFERQQFENKFFSLLDVYQSITNSMHYDIPHSSQIYKGKEFFQKHKEDLYNKFQPTNSFYKNRKIAIDLYTIFYIVNKESIAHYYRTLYRIFKLISESNFNDKEKSSYAKIVRAQLSESELFFINYNACTTYGKKFQTLINNYNLTKHLPLLERVEFKEWKQKLTDEKVNSINILLEELLHFIISENTTFYKTFLKGRFAFKGEKLFDSISLSVTRNNLQNFNQNLQEGYGLDDFSNEEIEKLLKCWALETYSYRTYKPKDSTSNLKFKVDIIDLTNNKYKITCDIFTKDKTELKY